MMGGLIGFMILFGLVFLIVGIVMANEAHDDGGVVGGIVLVLISMASLITGSVFWYNDANVLTKRCSECNYTNIEFYDGDSLLVNKVMNWNGSKQVITIKDNKVWAGDQLMGTVRADGVSRSSVQRVEGKAEEEEANNFRDNY